ncbi:hypothetical protein L1049_001037 [Liquidambar formosana]|uniref:Uncharacterized protein n=1 Tax=Liquidambar formosana TaxID=63359 RepID=A0AAP0N9V8_LIQFO
MENPPHEIIVPCTEKDLSLAFGNLPQAPISNHARLVSWIPLTPTPPGILEQLNLTPMAVHLLTQDKLLQGVYFEMILVIGSTALWVSWGYKPPLSSLKTTQSHKNLKILKLNY